MDEVSEGHLAGSWLSAEEHCTIGTAHPFRVTQKGGHSGGVRVFLNGPGALLAQIGVLALQALLAEDALDDCLEVVRRDGLEDEVSDPGLHGFNCFLHSPRSGDEYHGNRWVSVDHRLGEPQIVHSSRGCGDEDEMVLVARETFIGLGAVFGCTDPIVEGSESLDQEFPREGVIIGDENSLLHDSLLDTVVVLQGETGQKSQTSLPPIETSLSESP